MYGPTLPVFRPLVSLLPWRSWLEHYVLCDIFPVLQNTKTCAFIRLDSFTTQRWGSWRMEMWPSLPVTLFLATSHWLVGDHWWPLNKFRHLNCYWFWHHGYPLERLNSTPNRFLNLFFYFLFLEFRIAWCKLSKLRWNYCSDVLFPFHLD
jgi:hypothetical protein